MNTKAKDYNIAIIGRQSMILGFKSLGVHDYPINSEEEVRQAFQKICDKNEYAVVFIAEEWAQKVPEIMAQKQALPAVIAIPNEKGASSFSTLQLKKIMEQAVGSDILFK